MRWTAHVVHKEGKRVHSFDWEACWKEAAWLTYVRILR